MKELKPYKTELYTANSNVIDIFAESENEDFYLDECDFDLSDASDNKTVLD